MSSNESAAYQIMRSLDVDYVLIIFGGVIGYSGDDINKFLWMVRIAEGEHPKDIRVSVRHLRSTAEILQEIMYQAPIQQRNQCLLFVLTQWDFILKLKNRTLFILLCCIHDTLSTSRRHILSRNLFFKGDNGKFTFFKFQMFLFSFLYFFGLNSQHEWRLNAAADTPPADNCELEP